MSGELVTEEDRDDFSDAVLNWLKINGQTLQALGPHPSYFWYILGSTVGHRIAIGDKPLSIESALRLVDIIKRFKETPTL